MNEQYLERYEIEARRVKQREAARTMLAALEEFTASAMYDLLMSGSVLKGWNRSSLDRCLPKAHAAIAQAEAAGIKEIP
jgi:hypothetical protein